MYRQDPGLALRIGPRQKLRLGQVAEFGVARLLFLAESSRRRTSAFAFFSQRSLETLAIELKALLAKHFLAELYREAIRLIQIERAFAADLRLARGTRLLDQTLDLERP